MSPYSMAKDDGVGVGRNVLGPVVATGQAHKFDDMVGSHSGLRSCVRYHPTIVCQNVAQPYGPRGMVTELEGMLTIVSVLEGMCWVPYWRLDMVDGLIGSHSALRRCVRFDPISVSPDRVDTIH